MYKELNKKELIEIDGGWNVMEYLAMGIGYVNGHLTNISDAMIDAAGSRPANAMLPGSGK
ncbi:bacteriocin [Flavobacterium glaciei]|uniref:Bacteriocin-like protein n=1 Tax=Flavobacterium glaciei TaxID=386300 RepID=A0A562PQY6_9FLAO|nr:bacteriocin [Flavobacterium glaciei]RDI53575.1 bacteriocin-like protein [Flavobacterium glaciei]TWI46476.1 bacteriocin-like protein [Flavobacterium glaciei]